ncbi:type I phosphomannose isomerase catalytic subunit [Clostridium beijerinckii]|uniref:type I phosphomannose isomerase catalytic subunit n=1 Tax=Clostridium beijerinckii TaxID=1520 RepID=UPI0012B1731E|nr:type I phosphomannose isomerase catalytic subunit [Clostridium beijerinckii]MRY42732.1 mannose-6-phosphate isomerase [Parabacteroides distasonis]MZK52102.1 mannose-6-phosphate isomerase [Clostridium beijerinckii]MZK61277.1 mannose-6-phosphate isomerase [Clostridium beijerinckii]MZK71520.1 mannose-6-phosphate isomerase [Clostridium beijerinckii]MZK76879.1 mannose-6-phosphate isomerase [Clostridium beijerinckii]
MYPIRFENLYYEKIWGGRDLIDFRDNLPEGNIGESWDIACHPNGTGVVANGEFKGTSFDDLIEEYEHSFVGSKVSVEKFPLLIKLINSREKLSVQVHPGDEYAAKYEGDSGKTEAWYVVDAKAGANLIVGTKDCTKEEFEAAIKSGEVEKYLNKIEVKKGDCFLINSGLIHAICEGVIIAEIQQNSDVTYRVHDYGRPREIHVEKALAVTNFDLQCENLKGEEVAFDGYTKSLLCKNEYFGIEKLIITKALKGNSNPENFDILTCVDGEGIIEGNNYSEKIKMGDSYLIPAALGNYEIKGKLTILKSYPVD